MKPLHLMLTTAAALPIAALVVNGVGEMAAPELDMWDGQASSDWRTRGNHLGPAGHKRSRQTTDLPTTDPPAPAPSPYRIVIDGGSTGSRLHIFEFIYNTTTSEVECIRRGNAKAWKPLSAFARPPSHYTTDPLNATEVADHLLPLFEYAADIIPGQYHDITPATYQATAGMRLLDDSEQEAVLDALYQGLVESDRFVFTNMAREDVAILDGGREGFYGAVAANYLKGFVGADLRVKSNASSAQSSGNDEEGSNNGEWHLAHHGPLGALDMGGASAQIVFLPELATDGKGREGGGSCSSDEPHIADDGASKTCSATDRLEGEAFFSTSYLAYGVDQFRERLWDVWINDERRDADPNACLAKGLTISNPCGFEGHTLEWRGFTLLGTGDAEECAQQVRRLIPRLESEGIDSVDSKAEKVVGGVRHPPLRGKFYAMSLYFFTLDCLRELSGHDKLHLNWPTPSIEELTDALRGLCTRSWRGDLEEIQHSSHAFTRSEILPHRCFESVYMVTLLRDGFGFHPESRDITFAFEVEGSEVEWSLGMALAEAGSLEWLKSEDDGRAVAAAVASTSISAPVAVTDEAHGKKVRSSKHGDRDEMETNYTSESERASQTCPPGFWL